VRTSPLSCRTIFGRPTITERLESLPHGIRVEQLHPHVDGLHELPSRPGAIIWEADPLDFRTIFVSRQAEDVLGYPLQDWHEDASFFERKLYPGDGRETIARLRQVVSDGGDHVLELRMVASDGSPVSLRVFLRSICDWQGRTRSLHGIMTDVGSQRSEARSDISESSSEVRSSKASVSPFSGRGGSLPIPPWPELPVRPGVELNRLLRSLERPLPDPVRAALDAPGRRAGDRDFDRKE
jgi:PAS domain-containing protein